MEASMFFMGGMTMGYLHPPMPAKEVEANRIDLSEEKNGRPAASETAASMAGTMERTLIWARRILC
jgi:hypothetical protein